MSSALKVAQRNIASFGTKLDAIGDMATKAGQKLLPLSAAVGGLGLFAIKAASDFESSFAGVRKTIDGTEQDFAALEAEFRGLAKTIPVNVNELNRIAEAGGQLGVAKKDIAGFTRTMADMGVATNLSSDQAAEGMAQIANIMNNAVGPQFDRMGSTIVDLGNKSAATESQILEFGLRLSGAGKVAGLSEPEILGIGSALASVGINAEAGGTAFSKVFIELASAVAKGGSDLDEFAKVAGQSAAEFKRGFETDAAGAVVKFVEGLGQVEKEGGNLFLTLEKIGVSEVRMRDALLRSAGAGDLLAKSIADGKQAWEQNNALTKEAEKRYETFASQLQIMWNKVTDVAITLGTSLLPTLRDLVSLAEPVLRFATSTADRFAAMPIGIRATVAAMLALVAAAGPLLLVFGSLASAASTIATGLPVLITGIRGVGVALGALALNPWVIGFTALGAAILYTYNELNRLKNKTQEFNDRIREQKDLTDAAAKVMGVAAAATIDFTKLTDQEKAALMALGDQAGKTALAFDGVALSLEAATTGLNNNRKGTVALTDEQKKAMANLRSATNQLTGDNYRLVASFLAAGKSQADIATAYGFTEQQVRDVAKAQDVLVESLERTKQVAMAANETQANAAKELLDQFGAGRRQIDDIDREFMDDRMQRTLSGLNYELWSIKEWTAAQKAGFTGAKEQADEFYASIDKRAKQRRDNAVVDDSLAKAAARNKALMDGLKQINQVDKEIAERMANRSVSSYNAQKLLILDWVNEQKSGFKGAEKDAQEFYDKIDQLAKLKMAALSQTWTQFFQSIPQAVTAAIQGGGDVSASVGNLLGNKLGADITVALGDKLNNAGKLIEGPLTKMFGKTIGGALNAIVPILGPILGSIAGKVMGWLGGLFDGGEGAKVNDLRDAFVEAEGGADKLYKRLESMGRLDMWDPLMAGPANVRLMEDAIRKAEIAFERFDDAMDRAGLTMDDIGTAAEQASRNTATLADDLDILKRAGFSVETVTRGMADQLNALLSTAIDTGTQLPAAFEPYLVELIRAGLLTDDLKAKMLGAADPVPWQDMAAAAETYGIGIDQLGKKFEQAKLDEALEKIAADWKMMTDNGVEAGVLIGGMTDEVQELINKALTLGLTIPESMRPVIEAMFAAGKLTDENGDKLVDLSRINFAPKIESEFDRLIAKLDIFIDRLNDAANGINGLPGVPNVPTGSQGSSGGGSDESNPGANPNPQFDTAHTGGMVVGSGIRRHHRGTSNVIPFPQLRHAEVPAILQTGEAVLNRKAVSKMGERQISALNRGQGMGGGGSRVVEIHVTTEMDGEVVARKIVQHHLADELEASSF